MQIILMEKVANLGNLGDLLKVKNGYARNFLIPTGKAKRATPAALKEFELKRVELENAANATRKSSPTCASPWIVAANTHPSSSKSTSTTNPFSAISRHRPAYQKTAHPPSISASPSPLAPIKSPYASTMM